MRKTIKKYLDYIPLIILFILAVILIWNTAMGNVLLVWKHYVGLLFLVVAIIIFFIRHLFGVLFLGLALLLGLIGVLSYSPAITTTSFGWGNSENGITLLKFQPIFLLWLAIYFIVSGRHIVGIGTEKYWTEVKNKAR